MAGLGQAAWRQGLAYVVFADGDRERLAKNLSEEERNGLKEAVGAEDGDAVFFAAGRRTSSRNCWAPCVSSAPPRGPQAKPDDFAFLGLWTSCCAKPTADDPDDDDGSRHSRWTSMHHLFTMPSKDWIDKFDKDPEHAMSDSYDIKCATATKWAAAPCVSTATTFGPCA